jgi:hypothetical protein
MIYRTLKSLAFALALTGLATPAFAQSVGIGPRMSLIRGDLLTGTPSQRMFGGSLRMRSSKHMMIELALDRQVRTTPDGSTQIRETPIQGSLLLFPVRAAFSPYVLGGFGVYTEATDTLLLDGNVDHSTIERRTGWHLGLGAEMKIARHVSIFADYRFRFVHWGADATATSEPVPGSSSIGLKLTHEGSMWTSGMAFYF